MSYVLNWDAVGDRLYETGTKMGVLYVYQPAGDNTPAGYGAGVAWNGLTAVTESPSGAEATALYADDIKYLNLYSSEEFGATIEAYTYPPEFEECDGSAELADGVIIGQQPRKSFAFCYRTVVGNDTEENEHGYKLHIIYGCKASPSEKSYATINDSPEAITFSWEVTTTPVEVPGHKPSATVIIDSTRLDANGKAALTQLEEALYGVTGPAFSTSSTYKVGDVVTYESKTYRCKTAIGTAGAWDSTKWDEIADPSAHLLMPAEIAALFTANNG